MAGIIRVSPKWEVLRTPKRNMVEAALDDAAVGDDTILGNDLNVYRTVEVAAL
jgi:hypothetical protein